MLEGKKNSLTMDHLHPLDSAHSKHHLYINSLRLQGGFRMLMRQPSRDVEFSRPFQTGDPIHLIDWKAYARTDQMIIREKKDEAGAKIAVVLDASPSMFWPLPSDRIVHYPVATKFEIAVRVAFHLASAHARGGDLVKLWCYDDQDGYWHHTALLQADQLVSNFELLSQQHFSYELLRGLFTLKQMDIEPSRFSYFVSDCLDPQCWQHFQPGKQPSCLMHVLSQFESNIDWLEGETVYFDRSNGKKEYPGKTILFSDHYQEQINNFCKNSEKRMHDASGYYFFLTDSTPLMHYADFLDHGLSPVKVSS